MCIRDSFIVVWEDDLDENGIYEIFARGFNADGSQRFEQFTVNSVSQGQQLRPQIACDSKGNFVVVWQDDNDKNGYYEILGRGFNSDGNENISQFTVNSVSRGQQLTPKVARNDDGYFAVVWEDKKTNGSKKELKARVFAANGSEHLSQFSVNSVSSGHQRMPSVSISKSGSLLFAWEDDRDNNGYYEIFGRIFNPDGSVKINDFKVNDVSDGQQFQPNAVFGTGNEFTIVWQDDQDGNGKYEILAKGYKENGSSNFGTITVNSDSRGQQLTPRIAFRK